MCVWRLALSVEGSVFYVIVSTVNGEVPMLS